MERSAASGADRRCLLLEVSDLVKTFGAGNSATRVLKGVDLRLDHGGLTALLGQ